MIYIILVFTEYAYKNKLDDETSDNTAYAPPEKGKVQREKNLFGVKNLKTLKDGSLFVSFNSEPTVA